MNKPPSSDHSQEPAGRDQYPDYAADIRPNYSPGASGHAPAGMIRGRDIVVVGLQPWDIKIGSNCKNIAMELAKYNRVLYVNAPLDQITFLRHRKEPAVARRLAIRKNGENLVPIGDTMWNLYPRGVIYSINWVRGSGLFNSLNKRNNRKFAADIRKAIRQLDFTDFILFNDSDMLRSFYLSDLLQPALSIYYSRDNLMAVPYFQRHGRALEPLLMGKSTLVCANSAYLAAVARNYNPYSFDVGQGCDLSLFDPSGITGVPEDIAVIKGPVIGFIGALLHFRLDLNLLEELCRRKPEWSWVFVGKEDEGFEKSSLHGLSNVHFLGLKKEEQLPSYLARFDVAMNPQSINAMTVGNYPRKIDEYLAMGKPTVATATETMELFRDYVYMGKTVNEYIDLITKALQDRDPARAQQRILFARSHTWENSVLAICKAIREVRPDIDRH